MVFKEGARVKPNTTHNRILNKEMQAWLEEHKDITYMVERTYEDHASGWPVSCGVKLYKVDFWITEDLLLAL